MSGAIVGRVRHCEERRGAPASTRYRIVTESAAGVISHHRAEPLAPNTRVELRATSAGGWALAEGQGAE